MKKKKNYSVPMKSQPVDTAKKKKGCGCGNNTTKPKS